MSGSSVSAGSSTAGVRLVRGGELRVCPRTTISLTSSATGRDLAIGVDVGGIETSYRVLASSADTIMTPDFRILLAGPGEFNYAIRADAHGNTCIRSLSQNGGAIIVSEIMGDGTYQLQPGEQVYFRNGSVANPNRNVPPDCGCPAPVPMINANTEPMSQPVMPVPSAAQPQPVPPAPAPAPAEHHTEPATVPANSPEAVFAEHGHQSTLNAAPHTSPTNEVTAPKPEDSEVHVQVDAPFVYRGDAPGNESPAPQIAQLRLVYLPRLIADTQNTTALPPEVQAKQKKHKGIEQKVKPASKGFFGHIKSFFGSIFK